ncbi:hypothetical protein HUJ04_004953 [Dendroctonus ponderosae]|nr:hypothetical protein HUJ04_004953 [Dendroctonus ponderosae]
MALVGFIAFPRKVLLLTASYPQKDSSWSYKTRGFASLTISVLLLLTLVYNASFHIDNFVALSESLFICMSVINVLLKAIMLSVNQKTLWALVGMLETSTFTRNKVMYQSIISNFLQIVRVVDFGYFTVVFGSLLFRNLFPAFETGSLPMEFPHFNDGYFHYPFYFFQSFSLLLVALNNMALDLLVVGAVSIAAVQLQVLNSKLRDTKKNVHVLPNYSMEDEEALTIGYLKECCIYYSDIEGLSSVAYDNMAIDLLVVGVVSIAAVQLQVLNSKLRDTKQNVQFLPNYSISNHEALTVGYLKDCCIHYSDIEE